MQFVTHELNEQQSEHIESIFHFKGFNPDHSIERVVPTGHLFIIFELDGMPRNTFDNESLAPMGTFTNVWVSGMHKNYLSISAHQDSEMLVVQFKTNGAYPYFPIPIHQLNNKVVDGQDVFGTSILDLRNAILQKEEVPDKFKLIETWLDDRFKKENIPSTKLLDVLSQLQSKPFEESNSIISSFPNSQKHLIHQFKTFFGLTPKVLHRIFRFNQILRQIQNKDYLEWSGIAYEFGYSDQSHFIKEFKEFSGFNPQQFIKSDFHKGEPNFFPLDREG